MSKWADTMTGAEFQNTLTQLNAQARDAYANGNWSEYKDKQREARELGSAFPDLQAKLNSFVGNPILTDLGFSNQINAATPRGLQASIIEGVKSGEFGVLRGPKLSELYSKTDSNAVRATLESMNETEREDLYNQEINRRAREDASTQSLLGGNHLFSQLDTLLKRADADLSTDATGSGGYTSLFGMDNQRKARALLVDHARMIDNRSDPQLADALAPTSLTVTDVKTGTKRFLNATEVLQGLRDKNPEVLGQLKSQWNSIGATAQSAVRTNSDVYKKLLSGAGLDVVTAEVPGVADEAGNVITLLPKDRAEASKALLGNAVTVALQKTGYISTDSSESEQERVNAAMLGGTPVLSGKPKISLAEYATLQDLTFSNPAAVQKMLETSSPDKLTKLHKALAAQAEQYIGIIRKAEGTSDSSRILQTAATVDALKSLLVGMGNISKALGNEKANKKISDRLMRLIPERWQIQEQEANNSAGIPKPSNIGF